MPIDRSSDHPGIIAANVAEPLLALLAPIGRRMWPGTFHGIDRLPDHDRFMVVSNHSGMGTAELLSIMIAWYELSGGASPRRKIAGMAHPAAFRVPLLGAILRGLGAVEATHEGAAKAREAGAPLLLFPGGDHEAARPLWQWDRVDFAGRKGWIRLAREHGLSIVPMCITGSHKTLPIVGHGRAIAWATGLRFLGVHRAPLPLLSIAAVLASQGLARSAGLGRPARAAIAIASFWATMMVPWIPASIGFHILPPIAPDEFVDEARDNAFYERVVDTLERTLKHAI